MSKETPYKHQVIEKVYRNVKHDLYSRVDLVVNLRYDDRCNNGHNTFSITGTIYRAGMRGDKNTIISGCIHEDITLIAPELAHLIKWHLCSSDEPMHYVANSLYHAKAVKVNRWHVYTSDKNPQKEFMDSCVSYVDPEEKADIEKRFPKYFIFKPDMSTIKESDLEAAKRCAIWPDAKLSDFTEEKLTARLPRLMEEFRKVMTETGFDL